MSVICVLLSFLPVGIYYVDFKLFNSRGSYYLCKTGAAPLLGIRDHFAMCFRICAKCNGSRTEANLLITAPCNYSRSVRIPLYVKSVGLGQQRRLHLTVNCGAKMAQLGSSADNPNDFVSEVSLHPALQLPCLLSIFFNPIATLPSDIPHALHTKNITMAYAYISALLYVTLDRNDGGPSAFHGAFTFGRFGSPSGGVGARKFR